MIPIPRAPLQPGLHSFEAWRERYEYMLDCMFMNVQRTLTSSQHRWSSWTDVDPTQVTTTVSSINVDWEELRRRLERHVYATSCSRFRRYRPIW